MRWGTFQFPPDRLKDPFEVLEDLVVPEPGDAVTVPRQLCLARGITARLAAMPPAIELDHQLARRTGKIGDPPPDWMLPAELPC